MKVLTIWGYILCITIFFSSCSKTGEDMDINDKELDEDKVDDDEDIDETRTYHVSSISRGRGTGEEALHAADFLEDDFWAEVQQALQKQPITVKFASGNYERAHTEKTLTLKGLGHATNRLILEGTEETMFRAPIVGENETNPLMVSVMDCQNMTIRNLHFTGEGSVRYVLRVSSTPTGGTKNVLIENCSWIDMPGVVAGPAGTINPTTSHVTFKNCMFKRVGVSSGHMIYNAHGVQHVRVIDSHFEDGYGDYVRFRDNCDYALVSGCTFVHNENGPRARPFISVPNFNSGDTPDEGRIETFGTNYVFVNNTFLDHSATLQHAIAFHHYGHNRPGFNFLLTPEEGEILESGTVAEKKQILRENFAVNMDLIRIHNNEYPTHIDNKAAFGSFAPSSDEDFQGWEGFVEAYEIVNNSSEPFDWETERVN